MRVTDVRVVRGPLATHGVRQRFQACLERIFRDVSDMGISSWGHRALTEYLQRHVARL